MNTDPPILSHEELEINPPSDFSIRSLMGTHPSWFAAPKIRRTRGGGIRAKEQGERSPVSAGGKMDRAAYRRLARSTGQPEQGWKGQKRCATVKCPPWQSQDENGNWVNSSSLELGER